MQFFIKVSQIDFCEISKKNRLNRDKQSLDRKMDESFIFHQQNSHIFPSAKITHYSFSKNPSSWGSVRAWIEFDFENKDRSTRELDEISPKMHIDFSEKNSPNIFFFACAQGSRPYPAGWSGAHGYMDSYLIPRKCTKFSKRSGAKVCESGRSRKMLPNASFLAKIGVDTAENEPFVGHCSIFGWKFQPILAAGRRAARPRPSGPLEFKDELLK